jgi:predicted MFS family arabinose efflux permease
MTIFTNLATYMQFNVGLSNEQLPLIYLTGGICTVFSMNWIGRWADRAGKLRVFAIVSGCATVPILVFCNLHRVPCLVGIAVTTVLMVFMSGRFVPAMAMVTASVQARYRGGFMSANSSVQQFSLGLATYASGRIMSQNARGELTHFPMIGLLAVFCTLASIAFSRYLLPAVEEQPTPAVAVWVE